jgi:Ribosomal L27e protein family
MLAARPSLSRPTRLAAVTASLATSLVRVENWPPCPACGTALAPNYSHILENFARAVVRFPVAGLDKAPKKITREMSKKKQAKRMSVKPFVKALNVNHFMPTRFVFYNGYPRYPVVRPGQIVDFVSLFSVM